jgi:hypothetical protein
VLHALTVTVILASLYRLLKHVNPHLAVLAASFRLISALLWCVTSLKMFDALRTLRLPATSPAFRVDQVQALTDLYLHQATTPTTSGCHSGEQPRRSLRTFCSGRA